MGRVCAGVRSFRFARGFAGGERGKRATVVERNTGWPPVEDLAAEAERARTPWTALRALASVSLAVVVIVAMVIAVIVVVLALYA
jgi:hypothetical protein